MILDISKGAALVRANLFVLLILSWLPLSAGAQTITFSAGVQKYASLTNVTVNMSGRCELWVTNASTPLSGCTINLNSSDAWLFLPAVEPSIAASSYLAQVKVSGASAMADANARVVQYGQAGAIVIPQAPSFQPLTVFSQPQFGGTSTAYSQWTYYTGTGYANVSSFKLKRGYQVVLAQSANGANYSKCYVAQDGDLEIGVLPATLDKQVQFIYVTPRRWTPKKGTAGDPGLSLLNLGWWYNWNISSSSSRDLEYIAIRQTQYWPGLGQNWRGLGINTLLGYNEPDNSSQANLPVSTAISAWGDLLATGLRVGSPATTDGGRYSWLYPFVQQADAAGLRVDFVAVHYYWGANPADPAGAASQMYNFLEDIWNNTHRPIWVTEWNNGANWTDNNPWPPPTYAQQQACISAMTDMLENAPFVERYAIYNWVEDVRAVTTNGVLTSAGTTYRDKVSGLSCLQAMPDNGTRSIARFVFATNTWDSSGYYNNGMAVGAPSYTTGHTGQAQAIILDGANSYVQLPANIARGSAFTFAAWVNWNGGGNWQRIFDFGNDTSHYLFLTPRSGNGTLRFAINNGNGEQILERAATLSTGSWQHVAVTLNGNTAVLYVNGAQSGASTGFSIAPSAFSPTRNYLGKSQFPDPLFNGSLEAVEIADYAMSPAQISMLYSSLLYPTYASGVWTNDASGTWGDTNNWSGGLIANGVSRFADFSTIDITADRTVTLDNARTIGGLRFGDTVGSQNWTLAGANTLTLDGGSPNVPTIAVKQNTATISTPLAGTYGFTKTGNGILAVNGVNVVGGGLKVNAGSVNITGGSTTFGSGVSIVGYRTGSGNLALTGGTLAIGGELQVGGSDQNGTQYNATGTATLSDSALRVGSLTLARGNYLDNSVSGTLILNSGSTVICTNDVILQFAGSGLGRLALNGGDLIVGPNAAKWLMIGYWDNGSGELDITNGNLLLENGTSVKMSRGNNHTGPNLVNQLGGAVTFYSDAGIAVGGAGNLDLNYAGGANSSSTYNLNGGTLTVPQIIASSPSGTRIFNFNGGVLKAAGNNASFMASGVTSAANVRNGGAIIDTAGFNVTIGQAMQHPLGGDNAIDGGLTKIGNGTVRLTGASTYTGPTTISGGTLALSSGGAIRTSASINVSAGTTFDVSGASYNLGTAQTLTGAGTVNGLAIINGVVAPGPSLATLTFSTAPILNGTTLMELNRTNGPNSDRFMVSSGTLSYGGALIVTNIGPELQGGDSFQLFQAGVIAGSFTSLNLPALSADLAWDTNSLSRGVLRVVQTVSPSVSYANGHDTLMLFWPSDHTGWRLQAQTNSLATGLGTNWFDVPDSAATNSLTLPIDANNDSVFYRLTYP
ncbi:MAG TPA: LamG-like jellyroll fold domain-containing protein [Verrucomicrobiae bacterium]